MHLLVVSLLAILAGTLLLAKTKKDQLGKFFAGVSWFFVIVGFLLFLGAIGVGICKMRHCSNSCQPGCRQEMMMKNCPHNMMNSKCCPGGIVKDTVKPVPADK